MVEELDVVGRSVRCWVWEEEEAAPGRVEEQTRGRRRAVEGTAHAAAVSAPAASFSLLQPLSVLVLLRMRNPFQQLLLLPLGSRETCPPGPALDSGAVLPCPRRAIWPLFGAVLWAAQRPRPLLTANQHSVLATPRGPLRVSLSARSRCPAHPAYRGSLRALEMAGSLGMDALLAATSVSAPVLLL